MNLSSRIIYLLLCIPLLSFSSFAQIVDLDPDFGENGIVKSYFYGGTERATKTIIQPDGKILVAGHFINGQTSEDFVVIRLNSNGSLDYSFGTEGKVSTDFSVGTGNSSDYGMDMVLQPDGKIIIAGFTYMNEFAIMARYNSDGSLDTSFGTDGKVRTGATALDNVQSLTVTSIGLQSDGKIVLGGSVHYIETPPQPTSYKRFALFRYDINGNLDTNFGSNGVSSFQFEVYNQDTEAYLKRDAAITSIAIQSDDKIVAVGGTDGWGDYENSSSIARFDPNGNLDASFAQNGKRVLRTSKNHKDSANDVIIQPDGRIVMVGSTTRTDTNLNPGDDKYPILVARFTNTGGLDSSFGANGIIADDLRGLGIVNKADAVMLQPDEKILVTGVSQDTICNNSSQDFSLVRYNSDGTRDLSFGDQGRIFTDFGVPSMPIDRATSIAIGLDGKIVLAGESSKYPSNYHFAIARYTDDGTLDTDFSVDGKLSMSIMKITSTARTVAMQPDEKFIVGGTVTNHGYGFTRYFNDGKIDSTFSSDGRKYVYMGGNYSAKKILLQSDEKIIAAGSGKTPSSTNTNFAMLRLNEDGSRDSLFGDKGQVFSDFPCISSRANAAVLQNDGKIVLGGQTNLNSTGKQFLLQRYNTDGTPDVSFGVDGSVTTNFEEVDDDEVYAVALQADGKIVAAGKADSQFTLTRYNTDGSLDTNFGVNGIIQTDFGERSEISDIIIQSNGKITAGGHVYESNNYKFALARYNSDGTLDMSFGMNGMVTTDFGLISGHALIVEKIKAINYQSDGKLIAYGQSGPNNKFTTALARYNDDGSLDMSFGEDGMYTSLFDDEFWTPTAAILQPDNKLLAVGTFKDSPERGFAMARFILDVTTAGTDQIDNPNIKIDVYPNPSSGLFSIHVQQALSKIKIYNTLGQVIHNKNVRLPSGEIITIDLSNEVTGVYFLHLENDLGKKFIKKIIVK